MVYKLTREEYKEKYSNFVSKIKVILDSADLEILRQPVIIKEINRLLIDEFAFICKSGIVEYEDNEELDKLSDNIWLDFRDLELYLKNENSISFFLQLAGSVVELANFKISNTVTETNYVSNLVNLYSCILDEERYKPEVNTIKEKNLLILSKYFADCVLKNAVNWDVDLDTSSACLKVLSAFDMTEEVWVAVRKLREIAIYAGDSKCAEESVDEEELVDEE